MPTSPLNAVIQHLMAQVGPDGGETTDGDLLARFLSSRDENALAALVRRHAPLVWGVCCRLLHNHQDAEDAFQTTFLVLVRKAAAVPRKAVANWLYGVAHKTAVRLRATAAKRGRREKQVVNMPEPTVAEVRGADLRSVLDEELSRLPDHYRGAIVLCDLEGMTRREAAQQLGIPEGSVASRLARAREMLAKRLTRRGVSFSGGSVAAVLSMESASASAPPALVASTIKVASLLAAGKVAFSAKVAVLTEGVLNAMTSSKLKIATGVLVAVLAVTTLTYGVMRGGQPGRGSNEQQHPEPPPTKVITQADKPVEERADPTPPAAPVQPAPPPEKPPPHIVEKTDMKGRESARAADIREQVRIDNAFIENNTVVGGMHLTWPSAAFSPDGKILVTASTRDDGIFGGRRGSTIFWDPATGKKLGTLDDGGKYLGALAFTPDGRTLAGLCTGTEFHVGLWDVQTRKLTGRLKGGVRSMTFSADGTMLATECSVGGVQSDVQIWGVKEEKVVATLKAKGPVVQAMTFSGDGKSLAVGYGDGMIRVWDVKTERETARLRGNPKLVSALAFEPGDRTLLSTGEGRAVCRWDLTTRKLTAMTSLKGAAEPNRLAFGPGLATLTMVDKDGLSVWDTKTGARVSNAKVGWVFAFSADGKWLAAEPSDKARPSSIQVWVVGKPADK